MHFSSSLPLNFVDTNVNFMAGAARNNFTLITDLLLNSLPRPASDLGPLLALVQQLRLTNCQSICPTPMLSILVQKSCLALRRPTFYPLNLSGTINVLALDRPLVLIDFTTLAICKNILLEPVFH